MFGIFKSKRTSRTALLADYKYRPETQAAPAKKAAPKAILLKVGMNVRGADVVPDDYKIVNRNFRGTIKEIIGDEARVKMDGTTRIFRVKSKYLITI